MKLIRTKDVDRLWAVLGTDQLPAINASQYRELLDRKLIEEMGEFLGATTIEEQVEELGDIYYVTKCIAEEQGSRSITEVFERAARKVAERGEFARDIAWTGWV